MLNALSNVTVLSKIDLFACGIFFLIRNAEISLNFRITCELGQLWVSGGSLAGFCSFMVFSSYFVLDFTSNSMAF